VSNTYLLIDFGSTFTKVTAVECNPTAILGRAQSPTTVSTDIALGMETAIEILIRSTGRTDLLYATKLACSSAAGGLRLVVCGLVPRLTSEAGRRAALGAGAKVVGVFSYILSCDDIEAIEELSPDILLLAGGTDGGDRKVVLANSHSLAASKLTCPFVVAANQSVASELVRVLEAAGKDARKVANVMPEFGRLEVEPAREAIRNVFIERIVKAKGLQGVQQHLSSPIIPTPMAVLRGAEILSEGYGSEIGLGDLLLVDVGGATTDVDSVASGNPTDPGIQARGLPEPHAKRTVEGDLGIRFNAGHILEMAGESSLRAHALLAGIGEAAGEAIDLANHVAELGREVSTLPNGSFACGIDVALARTAVEYAVSRHAGCIEVMHLGDGDVSLLRGKDLRKVATVVGTGGIMAYGHNPRHVLAGAFYSNTQPLSLRPVAPRMLVDSLYIFYATGLLAEVQPEAAVRLQKISLREI